MGIPEAECDMREAGCSLAAGAAGRQGDADYISALSRQGARCGRRDRVDGDGPAGRLAGRAAVTGPARVAFDSARYAWEAGRYPEALERLERLLDGARPATRCCAPIALLTGELYRTRESSRPTPPSRAGAPTASTLASTRSAATRRRVGAARPRRSGARRTDTLPGYAAAFAPDGSGIAFLSADGGRRTPGPPPAASVRLRRPDSSVWPWSTPRDSGPPLPGGHVRSGDQIAGALRARPGPAPAAHRWRAASPAFRFVPPAGRLVYTSAESGVTVRAPDGTTTDVPRRFSGGERRREQLAFHRPPGKRLDHHARPASAPSRRGGPLR